MKCTAICFCYVILMSCNQPAKSKSEDANVNTVRKMITCFNEHKWESMAELYIEPALFLDPSLGTTPVQQSHQQTVEKYRQLQGMFPDIKDSILSIHAAGENKVVMEFVSTGKAKDGTMLSIPICSVLTLKDGRITEDHTYYDNTGQE